MYSKLSTLRLDAISADTTVLGKVNKSSLPQRAFYELLIIEHDLRLLSSFGEVW